MLPQIGFNRNYLIRNSIEIKILSRKTREETTSRYLNFEDLDSD